MHLRWRAILVAISKEEMRSQFWTMQVFAIFCHSISCGIKWIFAKAFSTLSLKGQNVDFDCKDKASGFFSWWIRLPYIAQFFWLQYKAVANCKLSAVQENHKLSANWLLHTAQCTLHTAHPLQHRHTLTTLKSDANHIPLKNLGTLHKFLHIHLQCI